MHSFLLWQSFAVQNQEAKRARDQLPLNLVTRVTKKARGQLLLSLDTKRAGDLLSLSLDTTTTTVTKEVTEVMDIIMEKDQPSQDTIITIMQGEQANINIIVAWAEGALVQVHLHLFNLITDHFTTT